jgi:hypothetical protein
MDRHLPGVVCRHCWAQVPGGQVIGVDHDHATVRHAVFAWLGPLVLVEHGRQVALMAIVFVGQHHAFVGADAQHGARVLLQTLHLAVATIAGDTHQHDLADHFLGLGIVQWGQHGIEFVVHRCTSKACGERGSAVPRCQRRRQRRNLSRGASSWIAGLTGQRGAMGERCLELGWNCGGWPSAPMAGPCQVKINTTRCVAYTVKRDSCTVAA